MAQGNVLMGNQITQTEGCLRMRPWAAVLLSSYSTAGLWLYDQSCTCMFCHFWLSQLHLKHFQNMHCIVSASAGTVSVDYLQASCLLRLCSVLQQEPPRGMSGRKEWIFHPEWQLLWAQEWVCAQVLPEGCPQGSVKFLPRELLH